MLEHGGRLRAAAQRHGIPLADWLDLSTGLAPYAWPLPAIPARAWMRLPEPDDELEQAAARYYGGPVPLAVAGSQAAIQGLPRLRGRSRVGVLAPCYAEHAAAWQREGHSVVELQAETVEAELDGLDVLLLVNPNNPTGRLLAPARLLDWHRRLAARGGWLVVDEAFVDTCPDHSLVGHADRPGLVVLRSFGKFFGLAGARLGFVFASADLRARLADLLGPWTVAGPTRALATPILDDRDGQQRQRQRLAFDGARLAALLERHGLAPDGGCALFQWRCDPAAAVLHDYLARRGILVRLFETPASLRVGLPPDEAGWQRLDDALRTWNEDTP